MGSWKMCLVSKWPIFHFHDYGRKCTTYLKYLSGCCESGSLSACLSVRFMDLLVYRSILVYQIPFEKGAQTPPRKVFGRL